MSPTNPFRLVDLEMVIHDSQQTFVKDQWLYNSTILCLLRIILANILIHSRCWSWFLGQQVIWFVHWILMLSRWTILVLQWVLLTFYQTHFLRTKLTFSNKETSPCHQLLLHISKWCLIFCHSDLFWCPDHSM